jgi:hypothetical protein
MGVQHGFDWAPDPAEGKVSAFGKTLTLVEWAREIEIEVGTIRHRLASGWSVEKALSEPVADTNRPADLRYQVPDGEPGSWTWYGSVPRDDGKGEEEFRYEHDIWAQDFVKKHPDGAEIEEICEATGIEASQCRALIKSGFTKLLAHADQDPAILADFLPGFERAHAKRHIRNAMTALGITREDIEKIQAELDDTTHARQEAMFAEAA